MNSYESNASYDNKNIFQVYEKTCNSCINTNMNEWEYMNDGT